MPLPMGPWRCPRWRPDPLQMLAMPFPRDPAPPCVIPTPSGPHLTSLPLPSQHRVGPLWLCSKWGWGLPECLSSQPVARNHVPAVLRVFCLKNPEKTGGVRKPEHKAKYMFQAILLLCLPAALDPRPSSSAYAFPMLPLGQLVSSYLMFKTQLPCPSPTAGPHSVSPCMVASLVQSHDGWLIWLAPHWAVASSGLRTTPCHFHVPRPRAEAHP